MKITVIKSIVIFMGVLILLGMGVLVWGVSVKFSEMGDKKAKKNLPLTTQMSTSAQVPSLSQSTPFAKDINIHLPKDMAVLETDHAGAFIYFRLRGRDGQDLVLGFDKRTGEQITQIKIIQD